VIFDRVAAGNHCGKAIQTAQEGAASASVCHLVRWDTMSRTTGKDMVGVTCAWLSGLRLVPDAYVYVYFETLRSDDNVVQRSKPENTASNNVHILMFLEH